MTDALESWLEEWGDWLDAIFAVGLATPSTEIRGRIRGWCHDAQTLGFTEQAWLAEALLDPELDNGQRAAYYGQLLVAHELLSHCYLAESLEQRYGEDQRQ